MSIKLKGSTDGSVTLQAPADTSPTGTDKTLILPTTVGSAEQFLKNSGTAGELEFSSMVEDSSGRLGIGTTSPSSLIHGEVSSGAATLTLKSTATSGEASVSITGENSSGTARTGIFKYDNGDLLRLGTSAGIPLRFETNDSERMRVTSDGKIRIGMTNFTSDVSASNPGLQLHNTNSGAINSSAGGTTNSDHALFFNPNGIVGRIRTSGSATSFITSSDYRIKENVVDLNGAITRVKQLAPKRFNFIADADTTVDGFLAHEAQTVVPEAVTGTHNEVDDDGNAVMQGIDQSKLVPLLTAALQEAIGKIETLETKVAALEAAE